MVKMQLYCSLAGSLIRLECLGELRYGFHMSASKRYFSPEHHWLEPLPTSASPESVGQSGDDTAKDAYRLGLTAFVVDQLGEITFVELVTVGKQLKAGDVLGSIESIKTISELYAPIDCMITATNKALLADPAMINTKAETDAWCVNICATNPSQVLALLDVTAYLKGRAA